MQVGMGSMDHYERDFEDVLLTDTAGYYKRKAAEWINEDSCPEYMLKVTAWGLSSLNQQHHSTIVFKHAIIRPSVTREIVKPQLGEGVLQGVLQLSEGFWSLYTVVHVVVLPGSVSSGPKLYMLECGSWWWCC